MMPDNLHYMVSYAQNNEDVLLRRALHTVSQGFYVDVGAQDPKVDSVTKHFYDHDWSGINIEPNPEYFTTLLRERPRDINIEAAVASSGQEATFHVVHGSGLSSLDARSLRLAEENNLQSHSTRVKLVSLRDVLTVRTGRDIHFLKVDVEGAERDVLATMDWRVHRPWIVVVEATLPMTSTPCWEAFEPLLLDADYEPVLFDGLNRWYVRRESAELIGYFELPVNVFDNYLRWREHAWNELQTTRTRPQRTTSFASVFGR